MRRIHKSKVLRHVKGESAETLTNELSQLFVDFYGQILLSHIDSPVFLLRSFIFSATKRRPWDRAGNNFCFGVSRDF